MKITCIARRYQRSRARTMFIGAFVCCVAAAAIGAAAQPDLVVDRSVLAASLALDERTSADPCLIDEGCLLAAHPGESGAAAVAAHERRTLLRFSTRIWNRGSEALHIGRPPSAEGSGGIVEPGRIVEPWWEYSACHDHWHLRGYAEHQLLDANDALVDEVRGSKTGFCMRDNVCVDGARATYTCDNQGISARCADHYALTLPCQWLDVTDVDRTRPYRLRVAVNVDRRLVESNYTNNAATVDVEWSSIGAYHDRRARTFTTGIVLGAFLFALGTLACVMCVAKTAFG